MSIIKSFSVEDGDMFYINHNSDNFTTIDCCYADEEKRDKDFKEMYDKAKCKMITRFISTHPDEDHIKGLPELCLKVGVVNFYCVQNEATKTEQTENFKKYCELRDSSKAFFVSKGCSRKWMNISDDERGSAGINFLWPDISNEDYQEALSLAADGTAFNNLSPIFTYSLQGGVTDMWMGDMEHDFLEKIKAKIDWPKIDILFAPHHGRASGKVSQDVLKKLNPQIIIIGEAPSQYLNYYQGYNTITQNSAGDILFKCEDDKVHVYISNDDYSYDTSFLTYESEEDSSLGVYLGTFKTQGG